MIASIKYPDKASEALTVQQYREKRDWLTKEYGGNCPHCGAKLSYGSTFGDYHCTCGFALWGPPIENIPIYRGDDGQFHIKDYPIARLFRISDDGTMIDVDGNIIDDKR